MATDLTDVLLKRQALRMGAGVEADLDISGSEFTAGNNHQMISQGLGNFLKYANAPEMRAEAERQEQIALEQQNYQRALDARIQGRADERLELDKANRTDRLAREAKQDLLNQSNSMFQAKAYEFGNEVNEASESNQALTKALEAAGALSMDASGNLALNDSATAEQRKQWESRPDIDEMVNTNRQKLLKIVSDLNADNISGNEVSNIAQGMQMFDAAWKPSTQATVGENEAFARKRATLQNERDTALARTTGSIAGNPELLSMQSEIASITDGNPNNLDDDIVIKAIRANPNLDQEKALGEIDSYMQRVREGKAGKRLQQEIKGKESWFKYALAKAIQREGGDRWLSFGDFNDSDMDALIEQKLNQIDMVNSVVREQAQIQKDYATNILKAELLFNKKTSGR